MENFGDFMEKGAFSDYVIQMSLREVDAEPLARALVDQDEKTREIIFRNMSTRAVAFIKDDIRNLAEAAPESIRAGQELFARLLEKNARLFAEKGRAGLKKDPPPPTVDLSGRKEILTTFCALAEYVNSNGTLPLQGLETGAGNTIFRRGLRMLIEGWDPLLMRSILENYKASLLRAAEIEYDLLIEGFDSLAAKENSLVLEERLRALVSGL